MTLNAKHVLENGKQRIKDDEAARLGEALESHRKRKNQRAYEESLRVDTHRGELRW